MEVLEGLWLTGQKLRPLEALAPLSRDEDFVGAVRCPQLGLQSGLRLGEKSVILSMVCRLPYSYIDGHRVNILAKPRLLPVPFLAAHLRVFAAMMKVLEFPDL